MRHWFRDTHFRALLKNTGYLGVSKGVAAACGIATVAFAGRGLGLAMFGMLILIVSFTKAASGLVKFQSWQLIVRYGGEGITDGKPELFKTSTGFAAALDLLSGIIGMIGAVLFLPLLADKVGIEPEYLWLAMFYCTLLPTMGAATPTGILRTLDRFDLISWAGTLTPISRAILVGTAFSADAKLPVYVVIYYLTDLAGDLLQWALAWRELRRHDLLTGIRPTLRPTTLPGAWKFAIQINLATGVQTLWGPIARLAVGGLLGSAGAALFRVASVLADSAQKPSDLLAKAIYPQIVRMKAVSKDSWRLMFRAAAVATLIAVLAIVILLLGGKSLITLIFGKEFVGAYEPLLILMVVPAISIFAFPLAPMLYALGRADAPLKARIVSSVIFFVALAPLALAFGVRGAAGAFVLATAFYVALLLIQLRLEYRRINQS